MLSSPVIGANTKLLGGLTLAHRLPAVTLFTDFARDGGLMAYGPNLLGVFRQGGVLAAKSVGTRAVGTRAYPQSSKTFFHARRR
jgi:putative ABC transport system substrate-binding protein